MIDKDKQKIIDKALALRYDATQDRAPKVVAKGQGDIARRIREIAEENGIPVRRDDDLLELLSLVDIDSEIPTELYSAVAELLSWIYRANDAMKKGAV